MIAMSEHLGMTEVAGLLAETLAEEKAVDQEFLAIAEKGWNQAANLTKMILLQPHPQLSTLQLTELSNQIDSG